MYTLNYLKHPLCNVKMVERKVNLIQHLVKLVESVVEKEGDSSQENVQLQKSSPSAAPGLRSQDGVGQDHFVQGPDDEGPGQDPVARRLEDVVFKEYDFTFDKLIKVKYYCGDCEVWITGGRISEMNHVDCEDEECDCDWISRRQLSVLDHLDRCHVNQECEVFRMSEMGLQRFNKQTFSEYFDLKNNMKEEFAHT